VEIVHELRDPKEEEENPNVSSFHPHTGRSYFAAGR
jgi:hypothetical protein